MPIPALKGYAQKSGRPMHEVETIWDKAKQTAKGRFQVKPGEKPPKQYWGFVMSLVKKELGLSESQTFKEFQDDITSFELEFQSEPVDVEIAPAAIEDAQMEYALNPAVLINALFWARDKAHTLHLSTTSYAQHIALGEFYDLLLDQVDQLAETVQGKYGIIPSVSPTIECSIDLKDPCEFICFFTDWLENNAHQCMCPKDTFLQNLIDEIQANAYRTKYKIVNLK